MADEVEVKRVSIKRDWIVTSGTSLALGLVVFVTAPIAANRLGPAGRGTLVTVQLLPQILAQLASVGLGFSVIHFGAQRPDSTRVLWRWALRRCLLGSIVTWTIGQALAPLLTATPDDERMLRVYLFLCPLQAFLTVPYESLRALGYYRAWNSFTFLSQIIWPIALMIGVLRPTPSLWLVVWLHLGLTLVVLVILTLLVLNVTSGLDGPPAVERPEYLSYGLKSAMSTIPSSANAKLDQLVMAAFVSTSNLGLYAAAFGWSQLTVPVMRGLMAVTMPFVSGATDEQRPARVSRLITVGIGAIVVLSCGGIVATLVLWGPLYGPEYRSALPAALVLMVASLFLQYNGVLSNILRSLNRPGLVTLIESAILVLSSIALIGALQISPVMGAAIVSLATYLAASWVYAHYIAKNLGTRPRGLLDISGGMAMLKDLRGRFRR